ncbi:unnamed protein product [Bursaphelenchus okinawaensis]|uniref:Uncharacterized protein n=1 Tax=Bursaphelenchus okinawaensis TaxID=465554 RepID=A0A811KM52_9BILA|nr:unnamed protein product [Bursaphelenchus okinawaensis]CAG9105917.1 unnamed protein product [Bursaphelenchus okinawaensis]
MTHCAYLSGTCQLPDGEFMIWKPTAEQRCDYHMMITTSGMLYGSNFIDDKNQIALTITSEKKRSNCYKMLTVTEQGFLLKEVKYAESNRANTTWSNIAAKIQYANFKAVAYDDRIVNNALTAICHTINEHAKLIEYVMRSNPTDVFRSLLNKTVIAKEVAVDIFELQNCHRLEATDYEVTRLDHCTELIPLKMKMATSNSVLFLDPVTMKLQRQSRIVNCNSPPRIVKLGEKTMLYYPTGITRTVELKSVAEPQSNLTFPEYHFSMKSVDLKEIEMSIPLSIIGDQNREEKVVEITQNQVVITESNPQMLSMLANYLNSWWLMIWRLYVSLITVITTACLIKIVSGTIQRAISQKMNVMKKNENENHEEQNEVNEKTINILPNI